jgi:hypothetical protein
VLQLYTTGEAAALLPVFSKLLALGPDDVKRCKQVCVCVRACVRACEATPRDDPLPRHSARRGGLDGVLRRVQCTTVVLLLGAGHSAAFPDMVVCACAPPTAPPPPPACRNRAWSSKRGRACRCRLRRLPWTLQPACSAVGAAGWVCRRTVLAVLLGPQRRTKAVEAAGACQLSAVFDRLSLCELRWGAGARLSRL